MSDWDADRPTSAPNQIPSHAATDMASALPDIDAVMYQEMLNAVGYRLSFAACDAAWRAIIRSGYTVVPVRSLVRTRSDA